MTPTQAYLILFAIYGFVVLEVGLVVWWMRKNSILLKINENRGGALQRRNVRCREIRVKGFLFPDGFVRPRLIPISMLTLNSLKKKELNDQAKPVDEYRHYWIWDIFKRKPYIVNNAQMNEIPAISMPIIGIKRIIYAYKDYNQVNAYSISTTIPHQCRVSLNLLSWIAESRKQLYEETKHQDTKAEMFAKIIIPMGMIILALACLVFFPKIYTAIMEQGNAAAQSVGQSLAEAVKQMTPLG
jgi:hypothetical protein